MHNKSIDGKSEPLFSDNVQLDLLRAAQNGDISAEEELVKYNLRLVVFLARRYDNTPLELEDLINIGAIGLIKAIRNYDESKNIRFSTYAGKCIENEIRMNLRKEKKYKEVSLYKPIITDNGDYNFTYEDILYDDNLTSDHFEELESRQDIRRVLLNFNQMERKIIELRFGFNNQPCMSQKEVAELVGCSRSNVSRILRSALVDIKNELIANYGYDKPKELNKIKR